MVSCKETLTLITTLYFCTFLMVIFVDVEELTLFLSGHCQVLQSSKHVKMFKMTFRYVITANFYISVQFHCDTLHIIIGFS
jgi:hypothetical protein